MTSVCTVVAASGTLGHAAMAADEETGCADEDPGGADELASNADMEDEAGLSKDDDCCALEEGSAAELDTACTLDDSGIAETADEDVSAAEDAAPELDDALDWELPVDVHAGAEQTHTAIRHSVGKRVMGFLESWP